MSNTTEEVEEKIDAFVNGYHQGKAYDMSEPREPRFEDDFDVDSDPYEQYEWQPYTIEDIAITKAHAYAQEYDGNTGGVRDKPNYHALKEGYMAGFLEGFAHRLTAQQPNAGE